MENKNDSKKPKITHRYIRRDSSKPNVEIKSSVISRNKTQISKVNNISDKKVIKSPITKYQSSSSLIKTDFTKKNSAPISSNLSSRYISKPSININDNSNSKQYINKRNQNKINQPRTPLIRSSTIQQRNVMTEIKDSRRKIYTPQINETSKDYIKVNHLTYYIRCPYCKHTLNQEPKKEEKIKDNYYHTENKENICINLNKNYSKGEYEYGVKKYVKKEKRNLKSFYVNEKGVIVFQQNNTPTTSIKIINHKPDLSKYINESKVFGKKKNIGIYEGPAPETKVFIRPIII